MNSDQQQQQRIMGYFIEEAREHLHTIEQGVLNLQDILGDAESINELFRAAHSIKGGAAMLGVSSIQHVAHRLEDFFKIIKENSHIKVDERLKSLLLAGFDPLSELLDELQVAFKISDELTLETSTRVKPVFAELESYLNQLTGSESSDQVAPAPPVVISPNKELLFRQDVTTKMRDMLQIFRGEDSAETRAQLHEICNYFRDIGERFDLRNWANLANQSKNAIAQPGNSYRELAPILIRELKEAQELVLANREREVAISPKLQALLPYTFSDSEDDEVSTIFTTAPDYFDEQVVAAQVNSQLEETSEEASEEANIEQELTFSGLADESDEANAEIDLFADNFADNDFVGNDVAIASEQIEFTEFTEFTDEFGTQDSQIGEEESFDLSETATASIDQLDWMDGDLEISDSQHIDGPKVGASELKSLAVLFENDDIDFEAAWEDIESNETNMSSQGGDQQFGVADEFADLLDDASETAIEKKDAGGDRDESEISQLFGDFDDTDHGLTDLATDMGADTATSRDAVMDAVKVAGVLDDSDDDSLFPDDLDDLGSTNPMDLPSDLEALESGTLSEDSWDTDAPNDFDGETSQDWQETSGLESDLGFELIGNEAIAEASTSLDELFTDTFESLDLDMASPVDLAVEASEADPEPLITEAITETIADPMENDFFNELGLDEADVPSDAESEGAAEFVNLLDDPFAIDGNLDQALMEPFGEDVLDQDATDNSDISDDASNNFMAEVESDPEAFLNETNIFDELGFDSDSSIIEAVGDVIESSTDHAIFDEVSESISSESISNANNIDANNDANNIDVDNVITDIAADMISDANPDFAETENINADFTVSNDLDDFFAESENQVLDIQPEFQLEAYASVSEDIQGLEDFFGGSEEPETITTKAIATDINELADIFAGADENDSTNLEEIDTNSFDSFDDDLGDASADVLGDILGDRDNQEVQFNEAGIDFEVAESFAQPSDESNLDTLDAFDGLNDIGENINETVDENLDLLDGDLGMGIGMDLDADADLVASFNTDSDADLDADFVVEIGEPSDAILVDVVRDNVTDVNTDLDMHLDIDGDIDGFVDTTTDRVIETTDNSADLDEFFNSELNEDPNIDEFGDQELTGDRFLNEFDSEFSNDLGGELGDNENESATLDNAGLADNLIGDLLSEEDVDITDVTANTTIDNLVDFFQGEDDSEISVLQSFDDGSGVDDAELAELTVDQDMGLNEINSLDDGFSDFADMQSILSDIGGSSEDASDRASSIAAAVNVIDSHHLHQPETSEISESVDQSADQPVELNGIDDSFDFADLEAMIGHPVEVQSDLLISEPTVIQSNGYHSDISSDHQADDMNFADLEALLGGGSEISDQLPNNEVNVAASKTAASVSGGKSAQDFDELEDLLKSAFAKDVGPITTKAPAKPAAMARKQKMADTTMRVDVKYLDSLNNLVGELVVNRNLLEQEQERLQQFITNLLHQVQLLSDVSQRMRDQYDRSLLEASLSAGRGRSSYSFESSFGSDAGGGSLVSHDFEGIEFDRYNTFHVLSQEIIELIVRVRESASDIEFVVGETDQVTRQLGTITTQVQDDLKQSRMVPFAQLADRLPRGVRDRSLKTGKQAELEVFGRETLIDKAILESLTDPLTHLVNNAIDHGLEDPATRQRMGKSGTGRLTIRAYHQGNQTVISISDDGAGIDPEKVKKSAVSKGVRTQAEVSRLNDNEVYGLLFEPGFSTAAQADEFKGRGVGLDVVKTCLDEIRGVIIVESAIGKGTTFTIRLPLTLSISKAMFCISDRARIAFPVDGFEDMVEVPQSQIVLNEKGQPCLPWRDTLLPFQHLSNLLSYSRHLSRSNIYGKQDNDELCIIILRNDTNYLALQVDQFLGEYEIVIKQLEGPIPQPAGIAGATVLGDGRVMAIANVLELFDIAHGRLRPSTINAPTPPAVEEDVAVDPTVLIVDDSITVRELLSLTFAKVGYRVEQAKDGQDAWEKLRAGLPCDMIFCDIEMPRMDGLELLSRLQKDQRLNKIPVAMLTSRGADRHRKSAIEYGAKGYFTKPYLEEELLSASKRLLNGETLPI